MFDPFSTVVHICYLFKTLSREKNLLTTDPYLSIWDWRVGCSAAGAGKVCAGASGLRLAGFVPAVAHDPSERLFDVELGCSSLSTASSTVSVVNGFCSSGQTSSDLVDACSGE